MVKKRFFSGIVAIVLLMSCFFANNVFAYNEFFSGNDVLFYDPSAAEAEADCVETEAGSGSGGPLGVTGESHVHKTEPAKTNRDIVAKALAEHKFKGNGDKPLNAVQLAAILGNLEIEAHFNPDEGFAGGVPKASVVGIVQWGVKFDRYDKIQDPKNSLDNQIAAIKRELDNEYLDDVQNFWEITSSKDIDEATFLIARNFEVCYIGKDPGPKRWTSYEASVAEIQAYNWRAQAAREIYNLYGSWATGEGKVYNGECNPMGLKSGGMNEAQAKSFMGLYRALQPANWKTAWNGVNPVTPYKINAYMGDENLAYGPLANCVAFSQYFINRYTTKTTGVLNGKDFAGLLISSGFTHGGSTPRVYSVFSRPSAKDPTGPGHTGVVLSIDEENDSIITGEAHYGQPLEDAKEYKRSLTKFKGSNYTYAYTDDFLKLEELQ